MHVGDLLRCPLAINAGALDAHACALAGWLHPEPGPAAALSLLQGVADTKVAQALSDGVLPVVGSGVDSESVYHQVSLEELPGHVLCCYCTRCTPEGHARHTLQQHPSEQQGQQQSMRARASQMCLR